MHSTSLPASATGCIREDIPTLLGQRVMLRALRASDAPSLLTLLNAPEVARFISTPPATIEGFEQFIARPDHRRPPAKQVCFAVTLVGQEPAIGVFQIREIDSRVRIAEWGFALGSAFWGTGIFTESAELVLEYAFEQMAIHRLEARAAVRNGRGGRALQKMGATPEGVLRQAFLKNGEYLDQVLYAIVANDWRASREGHLTPAGALVH